VKLEILLNGLPVEELSAIVHVRKVENFARDLVTRLKDVSCSELWVEMDFVYFVYYYS
jgi:translation elongation factor EF-4